MKHGQEAHFRYVQVCSPKFVPPSWRSPFIPYCPPSKSPKCYLGSETMSACKNCIVSRFPREKVEIRTKSFRLRRRTSEVLPGKGISSVLYFNLYANVRPPVFICKLSFTSSPSCRGVRLLKFYAWYLYFFIRKGKYYSERKNDDGIVFLCLGVAIGLLFEMRVCVRNMFQLAMFFNNFVYYFC